MGAILVTGAAGFIGSHVSERLLQRGEHVIGYDNLDPYYDPRIKRRNVNALSDSLNFAFIEGDIRDAEKLNHVAKTQDVDRIIHLAALANVRVSVNRAADFTAVNLGGTVNVLETARAVNAAHVVIASTSSVYGETNRVPFTEDDPAIHPLAPYPATKRAAELMAHAFHNLFHLPITALRFFNVYGPRGRPDMTPYKWTQAILEGKPITLFNKGNMKRDWTYVEDTAKGVVAAFDHPNGFEIYNLGRGEPVLMSDFVQIIEEITGKSAIIQETDAPASDPSVTYADVTRARNAFGYNPQVSIADGMQKFWEWFRRKDEG